MPLVLRSEKGSQLTFNEMDGNFTYLEELSQTGSFTGSFIGDGSGLTGIPGVTPIATGSFVTTSSFNTFTSSYTTGSFTGSFRGDGSGLTGIPGVTPIATGSFATTGSNQFNSGQSVSGSVVISGSLLQGAQSLASGVFSHAEGRFTTASGNYSHAEGIATLANGLYAHAEGSSTTASGAYSHAEGYGSLTINSLSAHAEGYYTTASADFAHAEGYFSSARGIGSHAEGAYTITSGSWQHVQGIYNIALPNPSAFIIGNGTAEGARSNLVFASGSQFQITGSLLVTGSANIIGGVTGSSFTGSFVGDGSGLTGIPGVTPIATGSFATTGSNIFVGNQTITGSLILSSSAAVELTVIGNQTLTSGSLIVTGSSIFISPSYGNGIGDEKSGSRFTQNTTTLSMVVKPSGSSNTGLVSVYDNEDGNSIVNLYGSSLLIGNTRANSILFGNASTNSNFFGTYNFRTGINVTGSLLVTGSANINGFAVYPQVSASLNFIDDAAAAAGGVPLGGLYRQENIIKIRLT